MTETTTTHKFYSVVSNTDDDWATELQPISASQAKRCGSCGATKGLFFRECGPNWLVGNKLSVRHGRHIVTQCWSCWIDDDRPAFLINKKGETIRPAIRSTVMFAKDKTELVWLVKRWKNGQRLMREVRTPFGDVVVFAKEDDGDREDYIMKCPHCKKGIELKVAATN